MVCRDRFGISSVGKITCFLFVPSLDVSKRGENKNSNERFCLLLFAFSLHLFLSLSSLFFFFQELCEKHKIDSRQLNELRAFLKGAFVPLSSESTLSTPQTKSQRPLKSRQFSHTSSVGAGSIVDSYESHGQFEIVKAQEKLARLQETTLDPYTLDFVHDDKVVLEMEDNYYREDASRFKSFLKLFFTNFLLIALVMLTLVDISTLSYSQEKVTQEEVRA